MIKEVATLLTICFGLKGVKQLTFEAKNSSRPSFLDLTSLYNFKMTFYSWVVDFVLFFKT